MLTLATLLLAPAAAAMLALPFGMHARGPSKARQMRAVYLFHRTGEPIAMVAPDHAPPIAAEELEPIVWTVRDFVETSVPKSQGYDVTSIRFDEEALVAVRGGPRERLRGVSKFERVGHSTQIAPVHPRLRGTEPGSLGHLGRRLCSRDPGRRRDVAAPGSRVVFPGRSAIFDRRAANAGRSSLLTCPVRGTP